MAESMVGPWAKDKQGQRVRIVAQIECKGGWAGRESTLALGAGGTIQNVDYHGGQFWIGFVPDKEYWKDSQGVEHLADTRHIYTLNASELEAE